MIAAAAGMALAYGVALALLGLRGGWILDAHGHPIVTDFLPVYTAGKLALNGHAALPYDWRAFHGVQVALVGAPFAGFLGWHYPPLFLTVAMALATLPYPVAFLLWVAVTLAAYALVIGAITGNKSRIAFALALPPVLACAMVGQNGFFTAALLGLMLLALPAQPLLAGVLLAALTFKPQFGVLLPFALLAGGYWRSVGVAALLTAAWVGIGLLVAPDAFAAFLHYLPETGEAILGQGAAGWYKLQSVYAAARVLGLGDHAGWAAQIVAALTALGFNVWLWHGARSYALKAAALAISVLLATPYLYFYDLPILAVPLAFLYRLQPFDRMEIGATAAVFVLLALCTVIAAPLGLAAMLLVMALTIRRAVASAET